MKIALLLSLAINVLLFVALYFTLSIDHHDTLTVQGVHTPVKQNTLSSTRLAASSDANFSNSKQSIMTSLDPSVNVDTQFMQLESLANLGQWTTLAPLLNEFLYQHPTHFGAQMLEGRVIIHTQTSAKGLEYLYALMSHQIDDNAISLIQDFINHHANPIIDALRDNQDWTALATFVEPLIQFAPTAIQYIEPLALSYAMLNLPDAMENTLASLPDQHPIMIQTRRLWEAKFNVPGDNQTQRNLAATDKFTEQPSRIDEPADMIIPLKNKRNQWYAPLNIGSTTFELLVDTGASTTAISGEAFERLAPEQRQFLGRILINTASGQTQARLYNMKQVTLGGWQLDQVDVLVLPVDRLSGFDGLLGMDILNRPQVIIDQISGALEVRL